MFRQLRRMQLLQTLNILIAGDGKLLQLIKNSKFLKKLYSTSDLDGAVHIKFNTFAELAKKCRALQIDIVLVENEKWILQGIADVLRKNFVNCIAPNALMAERLIDSLLSRQFLLKYNINIPQKLTYPNKFPLLVRGKGFKYKANTLAEVLQIKEFINKKYPSEIASTTFLEDFIEGEVLNVTSFFDGKTLKTFSNDNQILEYSKLLEKALVRENASFIGFFNSRLIKHDNTLYNMGFGLNYAKTEFEKDFLYILYCGIYQKLNEL